MKAFMGMVIGCLLTTQLAVGGYIYVTNKAQALSTQIGRPVTWHEALFGATHYMHHHEHKYADTAPTGTASVTSA